jgi:hypothetical protein
MLGLVKVGEVMEGLVLSPVIPVAVIERGPLEIDDTGSEVIGDAVVLVGAFTTVFLCPP